MEFELKNWLVRFKLFATNRFALFIFGTLIGSLLTIGLTRYPLDLASFLPAAGEERQKVELDFKFSPIELPENARIQARRKSFLKPGARVDLLKSYERSGQYLSMISAILEEYSLPNHLVCLPILESRYLTQSRSSAGAVGLWQLMPGTASEFGLKYNRWVDERRDPEKSTIVAAEYLRYLYDRFGNWDLALAAYNCGPAQLKRVMRREKTNDFWQLRRLPRETRNFVPNFYAILDILINHEKYGIRLPDLNKPVDYETIDIKATFSVDQIARLANVSPAIIKKFNPALLGNLAPSGTYPIRVPMGVKDQFLEQYEKNPLDRVEITYASHKVRRGDTLVKIANRYGTTVHAIMADNNLRSARWIKAGMKLRIAQVTVTKASVPDSALVAIAAQDNASEKDKLKFVYRVERDGLSLKTLQRYYAVSSEEIIAWNPGLQPDNLQQGDELRIFKSLKNVGLHRTRRGDSLWKLARRYSTTVGSLKRWNQLRGSRIYPGRNLIVSLTRP